MRTKKRLNNRGTLVKDTFYKSVPASFIKEINFFDNLPQLLSLHCVLNESDLNDQNNQSFRNTYKGANGFNSPITKFPFSQTCRRIQRYIISQGNKGRLATVAHKPASFSFGSGLVDIRELRDIQRLVCEDRKRIRQFVFVNSGGGRHYKKHIRKDELSKIRC